MEGNVGERQTAGKGEGSAVILVKKTERRAAEEWGAERDAAEKGGGKRNSANDDAAEEGGGLSGMPLRKGQLSGLPLSGMTLRSGAGRPSPDGLPPSPADSEPHPRSQLSKFPPPTLNTTPWSAASA